MDSSNEVVYLADGKVIVRTNIIPTVLQGLALEMLLQDVCRSTSKIEIGKWHESYAHGTRMNTGYEFCISEKDWLLVKLKYGELNDLSIEKYKRKAYKQMVLATVTFEQT